LREYDWKVPIGEVILLAPDEDVLRLILACSLLGFLMDKGEFELLS
jgi:hypothetical protein